MEVLLIATTNPGKLREILPMLEGLGLEVMTLADLPPLPAPEETGTTFAENARLKALAYGAATGLPTVAEDSGLEVDALGKAPGVHSARYGGEAATYPEKFTMLYDALAAAGAGAARRGSSARWLWRTADGSCSKPLGRSKGRSRRRPAGQAASATTRSSSIRRSG